MPFTIGYDKSALDPKFKAHAQRGIGRYVGELDRYFSSHQDQIAAAGLSVECFDHRRFALPPVVDSLIAKLPVGRQTIRQQLCFPLQLEKATRGLDALHFPAHMDGPSWTQKRIVLTVLDLIPLVCADLYRADHPTWRFKLARWLELRAIQSAELIIAISDNTARDLTRILGVPAERIVVTPLGVDQAFFEAQPSADPTALRRRYGISDHAPIILYVGGIDQRKNYAVMLKVFHEVCERARNDGQFVPQLVMAGRITSDKQFPNLQRIILDLELTRDVVLTGFIPDSDLFTLYRESKVFFFPSLYEGFGLTPLEAMAAGMAVVSSNTSAMPEVLGDGAILVAPDDSSSMVEEITSLLRDPARARELGSRGQIQARKFTWERTGEKTLSAYQRMAHSKARGAVNG